jgi:DNA-binding response OmpR family regulator
VLSVGQCQADHAALSAVLARHFGAVVIPADTALEAERLLNDDAFSLVLVNRILDADGARGLDLIQRLKREPIPAAVPVMLVSNHDEAQAEAVSSGAVGGFGKATLGHPAMLEKVRPFLT